MAWISVYQEVDGPKLRDLSKLLNICKAEALGLLNFLWFWGMNNADETGKVLSADRDDIADIFVKVTTANPDDIVDALFATNWLDDEHGTIYIHDWDMWQEEWYKLKRRRNNDAERKRRAKKQPDDVDMSQEVLEDFELPTQQELISEEPKQEKPKKPKREKPPKLRYADFVSMPESDYNKLVTMYGKEFADICVQELDLYKGSKGRRYKDDYRTILRWVANFCKEKYPGLLEKSKAESAVAPSVENPFEEW